MPSNKATIILVVVCALLLVSVIATYVVFNSKVVDLTSQKQVLISEKETLTSEKNTLISEKDKLQTDLNSAQDTITAKDKEFSDYKGVLKKHFSMSKVIVEDAAVLSATYTEFYDETSTDYDVNKKIIDKYKSQLDVFKDHIDEYKENLQNNEELFDELGFDTEVEISSLDESYPLYENAYDRMEEITNRYK